MNNKSDLSIFMSYIKRHKGLFALDMISAVIVAAIDVLFPIITRKVLYQIIPQGAWRTFWTVIILVMAGYVVRSIFNYIMWYWGHGFGVRTEGEMRCDLFKHIQNLSYDFYDNTRAGELLSRLTTDLFDITEMAHHGPEDFFVSVLTIGGAIGVMYTIEWHLALILTVTIPIFLIIALKYRIKLLNTSKNVKKTTALINTEITTQISGFKTAKTFANEEYEISKFNKSTNLYQNSKKLAYKAMAEFNSSMEFFLCSLNLIIIAIGGAYIMRGTITLVDLITFSMFITAFVSPVRRLTMTTEMVANGWAGLKRFCRILRITPTVKDKENAIPLDNVQGDISLKNISFSYDKDRQVLKNINLEIKRGEQIAFIGPSGCGKTTLVHLILRLYDVDCGSVTIDNIDVKDLQQKSIHKNIGILSQDVFLFAGTIEENIRYGRLDASDDEVYDAAKKAQIYDFITSLPDGFKTQVGERGSLLSGGQKQRIAIARVFLKNPPIIIFDEATSALDTITEKLIQETFDTLSKGRTTITIAHRLSTLKNATRTVRFNEGKIVEIFDGGPISE